MGLESEKSPMKGQFTNLQKKYVSRVPSDISEDYLPSEEGY